MISSRFDVGCEWKTWPIAVCRVSATALFLAAVLIVGTTVRSADVPAANSNNGSPSAPMVPAAPAAVSSASEPETESSSPEAQRVEAAPADAPKSVGEPPPVPREQNIYIPYEKLRNVFEKRGRGVFLPYEEFEALWKAARDRHPPTVESMPPVAALIVEADNDALAEKDVVRVKSVLKIEVLASGWVEVPLRLSDAAIARAVLDGTPARLLGEPGSDHRLLVENPTKKPKTCTLELEYAKSISRAPGQNSVSFQTPRSPVSRWRITVPQSGVNINVQPLLAAAEVGENAQGASPDDKAERTTLLAFVGAAPSVRIDWTPKAEGASGLAALAAVQAEQISSISEGVIRTRAVLHYAISRAELPELIVEVPADQKIVSVFDDNVRQWSASEVEGVQRITVKLFEPAKSSQRLTIDMERFFEDAAAATLEAPMIRAVGVGRQQGVAAVAVAPGLRADATKTTGLMQIDRAELPAALRGAQTALAYRYSAVPYALAVEIEKIQPRLSADVLTEMHLSLERISLNVTAAMTVERSGVFRFEFEIPEGYQVRRVVGRSLPATRNGESSAAQPAAIDTHHLQGDKNTRLVVNLSKKALGRVGLLIELQRDWPQRELLLQPGERVVVPLILPRAAGSTVEQNRGRLVILAPESLRIDAEKPIGLSEIRLEDVFDGFSPGHETTPSDIRPVSAWSFAEEAAELIVRAERRRSKTNIRQLLSVRVESGVARFECSLNYDIQYSGVKSLRIDLPQTLADKVRIEPPSVVEKPIQPLPDDTAPGDIAWSLISENEFFGHGVIRLIWEEPIDQLRVGGSVKLSLPQLKPRGVDRAWGWIVLSKAETLDIATPADTPGLRPIDPQVDLDPPMPQAARAFEFHDAWSLEVTITQYEPEEVKRTSIERGVVRTVLTPAGEAAVQAVFRLRSARQRLELELPPEAVFSAIPLRINGQPVVLERGARGRYFVPLIGADPDRPLLLDLRYSLPETSGRIRIPQFPEEPAVMKVYLCVYLPPDRALLGTLGKWSSEFGWQLDPAGVWRPRAATAFGSDDRQLLQWVGEGLETGPMTEFPTDGQLFVFSAMSPGPSAEGELTIIALRRELLRALVFLAAVGCGIVLLPVRWSGRFAAIGVAMVLLILGGVFFPSFSLQVLDGVFFSAVTVVIVLWLVWHVLPISRQRAIVAPDQSATLATPLTPAKPLGGVTAGIDLTKQPPGGPPPTDPSLRNSTEKPSTDARSSSDEMQNPKTDSDGGKSHD